MTYFAVSAASRFYCCCSAAVIRAYLVSAIAGDAFFSSHLYFFASCFFVSRCLLSAVCRSCFYQLRQLKSVKSSLTREALHSIIQAFVHCRLDYCNSALAGVAKVYLQKLLCRTWLLVWCLECAEVNTSPQFLKIYIGYLLVSE